MAEFYTISGLKRNIKACTLCEADLPFPPNPAFSFSARSKILIVGQAPGIKVHESGIPLERCQRREATRMDEGI